jgi:hypothetical protein
MPLTPETLAMGRAEFKLRQAAHAKQKPTSIEEARRIAQESQKNSKSALSSLPEIGIGLPPADKS